MPENESEGSNLAIRRREVLFVTVVLNVTLVLVVPDLSQFNFVSE